MQTLARLLLLLHQLRLSMQHLPSQCLPPRRLPAVTACQQLLQMVKMTARTILVLLLRMLPAGLQSMQARGPPIMTETALSTSQDPCTGMTKQASLLSKRMTRVLSAQQGATRPPRLASAAPMAAIMLVIRCTAVATPQLLRHSMPIVHCSVSANRRTPWSRQVRPAASVAVQP